MRRLGAIQTHLGGVDPSTEPNFIINGVKREELIALNSMILHEVYFTALAGSAASPGQQLAAQIERLRDGDVDVLKSQIEDRLESDR